MRKSWIAVFVACLLLAACLPATSCAREETAEMETVYRESPPIVGAARKSAYLRPEGSAPFPVTAPLVVLRGTWSGMGLEYGKRAATEIRYVFEGLFQRLLEAGMELQPLREALDTCRSELEGMSPELLEFMEGIAEGSDLELEKSEDGTDLTAIERITLINFFSSLYERAPGYDRSLEEEGSCWECRGSSMPQGATMAGANIDASFYPFMYRMALVVIPDDPDSSVFFTLPMAGGVGGPTGLNQDGVYITALAVKAPSPAAEAADTAGEQAGNSHVKLAIPSSLLSAMALARSHDVRSALETLLYGPHDIATANEKTELVYCTSSNFLIADGDEAVVVERDPLHYASRREEPDQNGGSFIACTDNFNAPESYDASGEPIGQPMSAFGLSSQEIFSSTTRLRSLRETLLDRNVQVDFPWMMAKIAGMNYIYDQNGRKSYQMTNALNEIVSCFESGLTVDRYLARGESPFFGTVCSVIVNPASLDIRYELGLPSDWVGPWEHINLGQYNR